MNDYCVGIAYATGCIVREEKKSYLVVRNLDKWYPDNISHATGYMCYPVSTNVARDGKEQWIVKARNVHELATLNSINSIKDFCRAFIEIRGVVDLASYKDRRGDQLKRLRLRIYGDYQILEFINRNLPAGEKKIQSIKNIVDDMYVGRTSALYYQSRREIIDIMNWLDGCPRNENVWEQWKMLMNI